MARRGENIHKRKDGRWEGRYIKARTDCFVLPSRYEGLPVVGVEAQAAGVPCVMADVVTPETKILESTAFVSPEESAMNWAMAVLESTSHYQKKDTSTELRKAGFDIEVEAKKLTDFYEELLK